MRRLQSTYTLPLRERLHGDDEEDRDDGGSDQKVVTHGRTVYPGYHPVYALQGYTPFLANTQSEREAVNALFSMTLK